MKHQLLLTTAFLMILLSYTAVWSQGVDFHPGRIEVVDKEINGIPVPANIENILGNLTLSSPWGDGVYIKAKDNLVLQEGDIEAQKGGRLILRNPMNTNGIRMYYSDFEEFSIETLNSTSTQLYLDGKNNRWGLFVARPDTELDIRQLKEVPWPGFGRATNDRAGLTITNKDFNANVTIGLDAADDLGFVFNSIGRLYIRDTDGKIFNASNTAGLAAPVQRKSHFSILDRVNGLSVHQSKYKSGESTLSVDGQQVHELMPEVTSVKGKDIGISYADFGLVAIKAIQEQQEIINQLLERIEQLEKK